MNNSRIIFIGTSSFAVPILEKLIEHKYQILAIITGLDKPSGRKKELTLSPVKQTGLKHKLSILQPKRISDLYDKISQLKPDLIITASYGQIIDKKILDIPHYGSVNLHPSLLPKYRGPSPIQTAILNGDQKTGISIMLMDEKMDHGPIISQKEIKISSNDTYQSLDKKLSLESASFLIKILPQYIKEQIKPQTQDESQASYSKMLTRQDGKIDWEKTTEAIERKVRAFYPWPGTWTDLNGKRIKILKAKAISKKQEASLPTGDGFLTLELVQPEGKKPMTGQEFFRGYRRK